MQTITARRSSGMATTPCGSSKWSIAGSFDFSGSVWEMHACLPVRKELTDGCTTGPCSHRAVLAAVFNIPHATNRGSRQIDRLNTTCAMMAWSDEQRTGPRCRGSPAKPMPRKIDTEPERIAQAILSRSLKEDLQYIEGKQFPVQNAGSLTERTRS